MEIINPGKIPEPPTKEFTCGYCGCIFRCRLGEYQIPNQIAQLRDGCDAEARCPTCGHMVTHDIEWHR